MPNIMHACLGKCDFSRQTQKCQTEKKLKVIDARSRSLNYLNFLFNVKQMRRMNHHNKSISFCRFPFLYFEMCWSSCFFAPSLNPVSEIMPSPLRWFYFNLFEDRKFSDMYTLKDINLIWVDWNVYAGVVYFCLLHLSFLHPFSFHLCAVCASQSDRNVIALIWK